MGKAYLAPSTRPTCRPSPAPRQRAACRPGRQAGARRRAPHGCHAPARRLAASLARLTPWIGLPLSPEPPRHPSPLQLLPLARPSHGRRHHRRTTVVAVLPVVSTPSHRVQELRRCPLHRAAEPRALATPETTAPTSPELTVAGDPLQRRRRLSSSPTSPVASTGAL